VLEILSIIKSEASRATLFRTQRDFQAGVVETGEAEEEATTAPSSEGHPNNGVLDNPALDQI